MHENDHENSQYGQSALELAQTALVKNQRETVEHSPLSVQPPPGVVTHGPSVVVDPFAPVMRRNIDPGEQAAPELLERVAKLEDENRLLRELADTRGRRIENLERMLYPEAQ
jgi:hypothetical protein